MNSQKARCQCLATCPNPPLKGEAFCKNHMEHCPRRAPLSSYEPPYEPELWNTQKAIRLAHNCFSYAFNIIDRRQINNCIKDPECNVPFHQPGSISGYPKFNNKDPKTCPNMISRLIGDNPTLQPSAFELKCPKGTSKIALIVDEDADYHFLRQDQPGPGPGPGPLPAPGYFSQKSGAQPVKNVDALGHKIFDVQLANHNFINPNKKDHLNYDRFCGYFCVPRDRPLWIKTGGSTKYKKTRRSKASKRPSQ